MAKELQETVIFFFKAFLQSQRTCWQGCYIQLYLKLRSPNKGPGMRFFFPFSSLISKELPLTQDHTDRGSCDPALLGIWEEGKIKKKKKMPAASHPRIPFIPRCLSVKGDSCDKRGGKHAGATVQTPQPGTVGLVMLPRVEGQGRKAEWEKGNRNRLSLCPWLLYISDRTQSEQKPFPVWHCALVSLFLIFLYSNSFSLRF